MANPFLTNQSILHFLQSLRIKDEYKKAIARKIPFLGEKERKDFLRTLVDIYLSQLEEKEALGKIKDFFQKAS